MAGSNLEKVYRGTYHYFQDGQEFTTEIFDVFLLDAKAGYLLKTETLTRLKTGDFLKIMVSYQINSKFLPSDVIIEKQLGMLKVKEVFKTNFQEQKIQYTFQRGDKIHNSEIPAPGIFQISTPSVAFSLLCTKARKPDYNVRNRYMVVKSENTWEFVGPPEVGEIFLELPSNPSTVIYMGDIELNATVFNIFSSENKGSKGEEEKPVTYYLSDHLAIPYRITDPEGLKVEVKNLNNLQKNKAAI